MPRVRMLTSVADQRHSYDYDCDYDVSPSVAQGLLANGEAILVTDEAMDTPEARGFRMERRGPGRPRKNPR